MIGKLPENTHVCIRCFKLRRISYPNDELKDIYFECSAVSDTPRINNFSDDPAPWYLCPLYMQDNNIERIDKFFQKFIIKLADETVIIKPV
jgi:hypothetical protein